MWRSFAKTRKEPADDGTQTAIDTGAFTTSKTVVTLGSESHACWLSWHRLSSSTIHVFGIWTWTRHRDGSCPKGGPFGMKDRGLCKACASLCSDRQGRGSQPFLLGLFRQPLEEEPMYSCWIALSQCLDRAPAAASRLSLLNSTLLATPRYHRESALVLRFHLANIVAADSFLGLCQKLNSQILPFPTDIRVHLRMAWS
jgi:hypothetical protein